MRFLALPIQLGPPPLSSKGVIPLVQGGPPIGAVCRLGSSTFSVGAMAAVTPGSQLRFRVSSPCGPWVRSPAADERVTLILQDELLDLEHQIDSEKAAGICTEAALWSRGAPRANGTS